LAEIGDDLSGKDVPEIHDIVWDTQLVGYFSSIRGGVNTTAAAKSVFAGQLIRRPDLHGDSDYLVTGFFQ
jgi:hypothetical protein